MFLLITQMCYSMLMFVPLVDVILSLVCSKNTKMHAVNYIYNYRVEYYILLSVFSSEDGYVEFCYVMKVPLHVFENHNKGHRKYKYHVESPLTQKRTITSLEFIAGVSNAGGGLIDRYLKLHLDLNVIKKNQCKFILYVYPILTDLVISHKYAEVLCICTLQFMQLNLLNMSSKFWFEIHSYGKFTNKYLKYLSINAMGPFCVLPL